MNENLNSNSLENNELNMTHQDSDYNDLITRLEEIKSTIAFLEKTKFK